MNDTTVPRRRRSWLLIVSLCLNVALLALIAVTIWRVTHLDTRIGSGGLLAPRSILAAAPDAEPAIEAVIDAHTAKLKVLHAASAAARRDAFHLLTAPDYTPAKMAAALDAVARADAALEAENIAMEADSIAKLTPGERTRVADHVKRRLGGWFFRQFRRGR
jgi:uncharacterized membrane protein